MWLRWRVARAGLAVLEQELKPQIEAATRARDAEKIRDLQSELAFNRSQYTDELWGMESRALVEDAAKLDILVMDTPPPGPDQGYWEEGHFDKYLNDEARRFLRRRIQEEKKARWKTRREVWTLTFSLLFGLSGIGLTAYNVLRGASDGGRMDTIQKELQTQAMRLAAVEQRLAQPCPTIGPVSSPQSPTNGGQQKKVKRRAK
jgi:hypothetical protein